MMSEAMQKRVDAMGIWGALLMGVLFAVSFCPTSAVWFFGLLALAGSIVNNGIIMIDKIEQNRRDGQSPYDAVIDSAVSRFRPILLSVATTMLGFMPLIIHHDALFYNMACVMFFGLGIGSLFTLNFVPTLYSVFFRIKAPEKLAGA